MFESGINTLLPIIHTKELPFVLSGWIIETSKTGDVLFTKKNKNITTTAFFIGKEVNLCGKTALISGWNLCIQFPSGAKALVDYILDEEPKSWYSSMLLVDSQGKQDFVYKPESRIQVLADRFFYHRVLTKYDPELTRSILNLKEG